MRQKGCCFHLSHCQSLFLCSSEGMRIGAKGMFYDKNKMKWKVLTLTLVPRLVWEMTYWIYGAILQWEHLSDSMHLQPYLLYHFALDLDCELFSYCYYCFLVYVHHLVWVGGAEQTTQAVLLGRQFVFLLRVSSNELANTVSFELKMHLHATFKMFLQKWDHKVQALLLTFFLRLDTIWNKSWNLVLKYYIFHLLGTGNGTSYSVEGISAWKSKASSCGLKSYKRCISCINIFLCIVETESTQTEGTEIQLIKESV